jgi:hypothetical protein
LDPDAMFPGRQAQDIGGDYFKATGFSMDPAQESEWAKAMGARQGRQKNQDIAGVGEAVQGAQATERANLATRGGLTTGAAERMGQRGQVNRVFGTQDVRNKYADVALQTDINDQTMRLGALNNWANLRAKQEQTQADYDAGRDMARSYYMKQDSKGGLLSGLL